MTNLLLLHLELLVMAALGLGPGPTAPTPTDAPRPASTMTECTTSVTVGSAVNSSGKIVVTMTSNNANVSPCSVTQDTSTTCTFTASGNVRVSYNNNASRWAYYSANINTLQTPPPISIAAGTSLDFAVVGANNGDVLAWPDPRIIVLSGSCT